MVGQEIGILCSDFVVREGCWGKGAAPPPRQRTTNDNNNSSNTARKCKRRWFEEFISGLARCVCEFEKKAHGPVKNGLVGYEHVLRLKKQSPTSSIKQ